MAITLFHLTLCIQLLFVPPIHSQLKYLGTTLVDENAGYFPLDGGREIIVSPDGEHAYVTAEISSAVGIFSRDPVTGILDSVGILVDETNEVTSLGGVRAIVASPDGRHVYTSGQMDDEVSAFARDTSTGALTFLMSLPIGGPDTMQARASASIAISPDGLHLYATQFDENLLCLFIRDLDAGTLQAGDCISPDSIGGQIGLTNVTSVTLSPDGKNAYSTSNHDKTVLAFRRDSLSGNLKLIQRFTNGENDVSGLGGARAVVVSPDGRNVYAVTETDHTIVTFSRDSSNGELTIIDQYLNDSLLHWGVDLAVHPSGKYVYAIGEISNAVSAYRRDTATGELSYFSHFSLSGHAQRGLYAAYGVAASPDGKHVYSLGWEFGSVNFYEVVDTLVAPVQDPRKNHGHRNIPGKTEWFTLSYSSQLLFQGYLPPVTTILVKDVRGQTVFTQPVEGNRMHWSEQKLNALPPGMYHLIFMGEEPVAALPWVKL